jgi:hypothetical protein
MDLILNKDKLNPTLGLQTILEPHMESRPYQVPWPYPVSGGVRSSPKSGFFLAFLHHSNTYTI